MTKGVACTKSAIRRRQLTNEALPGRLPLYFPLSISTGIPASCIYYLAHKIGQAPSEVKAAATPGNLEIEW
jgi:hypothetical protein